MSDIQTNWSGAPIQRAVEKLAKKAEGHAEKEAQIKALTDKVNAQIGPLEGAESSRAVEQMRAKLAKEGTDPKVQALVEKIGQKYTPPALQPGRVKQA
ncbi:MAG: hypothetical protein AB7F31_03695 [Parachlamydiales bacterium]